ncbi:4861_t:CDS:2, partial [Funneliformis geosporum]
LLSEGDSVEYLGKSCNYKATIREGRLCIKDQIYHSFTEFIRAARKLKQNEKPSYLDFQNLKINDMAYWEQDEDGDKGTGDSSTSERKLIELLTVPWNDILENRLCQLYAKDNVVDIFWGRNILNGDTTWSVYVVTRGNLYLHEKIEEAGGQVIRLISEEKGFLNAVIPPQSPDDNLPTRKKVPQDLQKVFDKALNYELGPSFREAHYNLVGMSTGYKRTRRKFTKEPAIILYVRQKGILRRGCALFPDKICGYPVDVVEACAATPCGFGATACQSFQEEVKLGSSIGIIEPHRTSGTISAIVQDKHSKQIGILSCEHVCRFSESSHGTNVIIHQPSHVDLDEQKLSFTYMEKQNVMYKNAAEEMYKIIDNFRQNSALASYKRGMRSQFYSQALQKDFGVDAAFCIFTNRKRMLCPNKFSTPPEEFKKAKIPENICLNDFYTYEMFDNIDEIEVFKVGRTTGLTQGKLVPISIAIAVSNENIEFAKEQGEISSSKTYSNIINKNLIGYMKASLIQIINEKRQQCYPTLWFDRQLLFDFRHEDFLTGDSGASVVDQNGKALGILHAAMKTGNSKYVIASPYFAVFEALNLEGADFEEGSSSSN